MSNGDHLRVVQTNLNRSWRAFDLLKQYIAEHRTDICLISEPPAGVSSEGWACCRSGLASVRWSYNLILGSVLFRGNDFVLVKMRNIAFISCYFSPNASTANFLLFLDELERAVHPYAAGDGRLDLLICGDFNAKSPLWGSPVSNRRGEILQDWMAQLGLCLINTGLHPTCSRPQGSSFIDLTWASPGLSHRISGWYVLDIDTLGPSLYCLSDRG